MYLLIILLPALNFLLSLCLGRFLGKKGVYTLSIIILGFSFLCSCLILWEVGFCESYCILNLGCWINTELFHVSWLFNFDVLTALMLFVVLSVSWVVHIYSGGYMWEDPFFCRFFSYLSLFTFFMILLVTSSNFIQLFLGWEGVGICSYLLINFWFTRIQANKSSIKAMLMNRVGDLGLVVGIALVYCFFNTIVFEEVFVQISYLNCNAYYIGLICFCLFVGAVGKSAQLGLHTWLPDAMEGPTPVSALIHAATMVTAGIFLMVRTSFLFEYSGVVLGIIGITGALTAFFSATMGLVQHDLKRVIAYSTCSQLGYMVLSIGISGYSVAIFHLLNHAFFKALLFLGAGCIIHGLFDEQDMRKMGGIRHLLPFSYSIMCVGSLALIGFPYLTGYYSKDLIIELAFSSFWVDGLFMSWIALFTAGLTAFYSFRVLYFVFYSRPRMSMHYFKCVHEVSGSMMHSLWILILGTIFVGYILSEAIVGLGSSFWSNSIFVYFFHNVFVYVEFLNLGFKLLPLIFTLVGLFLSYLFYVIFLSKFIRYYIDFSFIRECYILFSKRWYIDIFYNKIIVSYLYLYGYFCSFFLLDKGLFELIGPRDIGYIVRNLGLSIVKYQSGYIYHYAFSIVLGIILMVSIIVFSAYIPIMYLVLFLISFFILISF